MEIQKIKQLLKLNKHVLIDFTDKFINTDYEILLEKNKYISKASEIYLEIDNKLKENKYKNVVFLLNISLLIKHNYNFYMLLLKNKEIPLHTNIYLLKNSNNFCWFKIDEFEINKKIIIDFISNKNELYNCNVCFNEKNEWNEHECCKICNFRTCFNCIIDARNHNLNNKCYGCRADNNDKYNLLYKLIDNKLYNNII